MHIPRVFYRSAIVAAVAAAGLVGATEVMGPTAAHAAAPVNYVALGDSYSSGVGAGDYISSSGSCDRGDRKSVV